MSNKDYVSIKSHQVCSSKWYKVVDKLIFIFHKPQAAHINGLLPFFNANTAHNNVLNICGLNYNYKLFIKYVFVIKTHTAD